MRGKVGQPIARINYGRITPAYAGKRLETASLIVRNQDHPRLCGEKRNRKSLRRVFPGSPPPMRGKVHTSSGIFEFRGITPAYAGKSTCVHQQKAPAKDHPRLCGEKPERCICPHSLVGSPPPMRGKGISGKLTYSNVGITPAYAGKR